MDINTGNGMDLILKSMAGHLQKENEELRKINQDQLEQIKQLSQNIANLSGTVEYLKRKLYGKASEKTPDPNQLNFFNEAGTSADPSAPEPTKTEVVKGYDRKQKSTRTDSFGDLPIHKVLCHVNEKDKTCPLCGEQMKLVGKRFVREELQIIPARVKRVHCCQEVYACPRCKKEDEEFVTTAADNPGAADEAQPGVTFDGNEHRKE